MDVSAVQPLLRPQDVYVTPPTSDRYILAVEDYPILSCSAMKRYNRKTYFWSRPGLYFGKNKLQPLLRQDVQKQHDIGKDVSLALARGVYSIEVFLHTCL